MRILYVFRYFLKEALFNLWANRLNNLVSIIIISFSLFTLGLFLLSADNLNRLIGKLTENIQVNVFLNENSTGEERSKLEEIIKSSPAVGGYQYIDPKEALKRFRSFYPGMKELTDQLDTNPFPSSFEVSIKKEFQNKTSVQDFVSKLRDESYVEDVEYDQEWIDRVQFIIRFVQIVGVVFGGILMFAATFSISNVIKLMVLSRKDEIEIMRLVGATNSFIKGPFLAEGILQGLFGSLLAISFLYLIFVLIMSKVSRFNTPFFSLNELHFLPVWMILSIVVGGMLLGFLGSLFSLGRFLKI
jgi:cell division transport system permease protein